MCVGKIRLEENIKIINSKNMKQKKLGQIYLLANKGIEEKFILLDQLMPDDENNINYMFSKISLNTKAICYWDIFVPKNEIIESDFIIEIWNRISLPEKFIAKYLGEIPDAYREALKELYLEWQKPNSGNKEIFLKYNGPPLIKKDDWRYQFHREEVNSLNLIVYGEI